MKDFMTIKQASEKWNVSIRTIQAMCSSGKIKGASKIANVWVIPKSTEYPIDRRIKTGKYVDWRNTNKKKNNL